ncbi:hypothetical protein [Streptomyces sp. NPDC015131]|uniref:hypothetical protein n=1 Tax=Streptomyces sp. NPDC015131 TaxID=3364941 RepID=UPI0036FE5C90
MNWTWAITYHKDRQPFVVLSEKPDRAVLAEMLASWLVRTRACHLPGAYRLADKLVVWANDKEHELWTFDTTPDMLRFLAPEDEFLWGDDEFP